MPLSSNREVTIATVGVCAGVCIGATSAILLTSYLRDSRQSNKLANDLRCVAQSVEEIRQNVKELRELVQGTRLTSSRTNSGYFSIHRSRASSEDEFFEALEGEPLVLPGYSSEISANGDVGRKDSDFFANIDKLLEGDNDDKTWAYNLMEQSISPQNEQDAEFMLRLAKATHYYARVAGLEQGEEVKKELCFKAKDYAYAALALKSKSAEIHKWCAVTLGCISDYVGTQQKIKDGFQFKEHCEISLRLNPEDALVQHLLGRWCYSVAMLTWFERKVANTLLPESIEATTEESKEYLLKAEQLMPNSWKENQLYIAKCYLAESDYTMAVKWLEKAYDLPVNDADDQVAHSEVETLLSKYRYSAHFLPDRYHNCSRKTSCI